MGGTTSPLQTSMVNAARLVLDNCALAMSTNKISRLVRRFINWAPAGDGQLFFQFLANEVQMSEAQKRAAMSNPDIARAISYCDPTGETAVNNVLRRTR
jgi:hypothetical protein